MATRMFKGDIKQDLFCQIIIELLKSHNRSASELKQEAKSIYKERCKKKIHGQLTISDKEYYYRIRRLKHEGLIQKRGQEYIMRDR